MNPDVPLDRISPDGQGIRTQTRTPNPRTILRVMLLVSAALAGSSSAAMAQAGKLDSTFGTGGIFTDSAASLGTAVALQSDGKIVAGGQSGFEPAVARVTANGTLDSTFGSHGTVIISFPGDDFGGSQVIGIAIQSDGRILTGISNFVQGFDPMFIIARLNTNGSLDTTFGSGGVVETQIGQFGAPDTVLALQPDGRIVVAGSRFMARYDNNGQLDSTFGSNGIAPITLVGPTAIALQPDGKILLAAGGSVVAFATTPGVTFNQVAGIVSRYDVNGSLDKTFGSSGQAASVVVAGAMTVERDGICTSTCKILVSGSVVNGSSASHFGFGVERLNSNGSVDTTFAVEGEANTTFPSNDATPFAMAIQSNGAIVAAGAAGQPEGNTEFVTPADFALARYTSSGASDTTFASNGETTTTFGANQGAIYALALQGDGKIVAVGTSLQNVPNGGKPGGLIVARYLAN